METRDIVNKLTIRFKTLSTLYGKFRPHGEKAWAILTSNPASDLVSPPACLCFSLEAGRIIALHAERVRSKYKLLAVKTYPVEGKSYPSPGELASIYEITRASCGLADCEVLLCLPKAWVIFQEVTLPAAVADNLSQVMVYEFDRFMPFGAADAAYDYVTVPSGDKIQLSLAACKGPMIMEYVAALAQVGGTVGRISFDLSALSSMCRFLSQQDSFVFAHLDGAAIRGGRVENGALKTCFAQSLPDTDENAHRVREGLQALVDAVNPERIQIPLFLTFGDGMAVVREQLQSTGDIAFRTIDEASAAFSGPAPLAPSSYTAAGAAVEHLWPKADGFNLLAKGERVPTRPSYSLTIILLAAILISLVIYALMPLQIEEQRLKEIDRQIALRKDQVRAAEAIIKEMEDINKEQALISRFKQEKPLYIDMLRELTTIIPKNAWLSRVRISGTQVNIEGYSPSASGLVEILEASKHFQKVEFSSPTFRDARQNMDRFQIKMELKGFAPEGKSNGPK